MKKSTLLALVLLLTSSFASAASLSQSSRGYLAASVTETSVQIGQPRYPQSYTRIGGQISCKAALKVYRNVVVASFASEVLPAAEACKSAASMCEAYKAEKYSNGLCVVSYN